MGRTSDARERLIESARELIYARGYNSVGVEEICQHAGVNKGSFYHFYASKRDLVLDVIRAEDADYRRVADQIVQAITSSASSTDPGSRITKAQATSPNRSSGMPITAA